MISRLPRLLLSFLSILTVTFSSSNDFSVVNCSSSAMCGAVNISYPFWRYDGPSSFSAYCGYPGFMINCVNDMHAILHIGSGSYNVSNISYANRTIYLIDTDVLTGPELKSCARVRRNLTFTGDIASSSLNYTGADAYLTFFFNCSDAGPPQEFQQNVISCHGYARKSSYVFPSDKVPPEILGSACEDVVVAPVLLDFLRDHSWEPAHDFNEAPNYGFQLAWFPGAPEGCKECESSSRLCGFNKTSSRSLCFCSDGTLARDCPSDGSSVVGCSSSAMCGGVNISYPFLLSPYGGIPPSAYCGYPGFWIDCQEGIHPILSIGSGSYNVAYIDYPSRTINLTYTEVLTGPNLSGCPRVLHNLTFSSDVSSSLKYTDADANLTFFFNCSDPGLPQNFPQLAILPCLGYPGKSSFVFPSGKVPPGSWSSTCEDVVVAPVMLDILNSHSDDLPVDELGEVLSSGFQLAWPLDPPEGCEECESSGERCGFNQTGSSGHCVCFNGTQARDCPSASSSKKKHKVIIGISVGAVVVIGLCGLGLFLYIQNRRRRHSPSSANLIRNTSSDPNSYSKSRDTELGGGSSVFHLTHLFSYDELEAATDGFSDSREIGDGGFGTVYKGILRDGRVVAIKRLYENNWRRVEQFKNEVAILSLIRHPNLVTLYGCTSRHSRELLLVYEYISNGTIADHLHGSHADEHALTWPLRLSIAIETADALTYLHAVNPPIIHRDVKTNNILLDADFHVKVADFGLSRLFPLHATHVSTAPQGTPGYVDPEYHKCFQLTDKSDVYSFGVVLVELISSMPAVDITRRRDEINLANMAIRKIQNYQLEELVDPALGYEEDFTTKRMITMVAELAFRCLQPDGEMRPPIKEVVEVLREIQKEGYDNNSRVEEGDIVVKEDSGLLKNIPPFSPDSVAAKWASRTTTPNTSE